MAACVGCNGRGGWYSPDNGQWVVCHDDAHYARAPEPEADAPVVVGVDPASGPDETALTEVDYNPATGVTSVRFPPLTCCKVGCGKPAAFEIGGPGRYDTTYACAAHRLAAAIVPELRPPFPPPLFPPPDGDLLAGECPRCETAFVTRDVEGRAGPWVVICDNPKCRTEIHIE